MVKRHRKNFFFTFLLTIFFWVLLILQLIFFDPILIKDLIIPSSYFLFFLNLFFASFFTLAIIFTNSRRGFIFTLGLVTYLILRLFDLGNFLNAFLIISLIVALELYFTKTN